MVLQFDSRIGKMVRKIKTNNIEAEKKSSWKILKGLFWVLCAYKMLELCFLEYKVTVKSIVAANDYCCSWGKCRQKGRTVVKQGLIQQSLYS